VSGSTHTVSLGIPIATGAELIRLDIRFGHPETGERSIVAPFHGAGAVGIPLNCATPPPSGQCPNGRNVRRLVLKGPARPWRPASWDGQAESRTQRRRAKVSVGGGFGPART
jgi:hypothetical protein